MISEWWEEWGWKPVPPSFLPSSGCIVEDDEGPLYVAFVYMTGTGICWLEWLLTSKKIYDNISELLKTTENIDN
jgi:hypothetical protein